MPFSNVDELKASDLFKRLTPLQRMSSAKLSKFIAVLNAVLGRAMRNGADESEAEARAIPLALSAARNAMQLPAGRTAEADTHVFGVFAAHMYHSGGGDILENTSTDLRFPDIDTLNDLLAGQPFNNRHDRTDPVGVIRRVIAAKDAPAGVRVDPDIPFLIEGSFFADVPADERFDQVSGEWDELKFQSGETLALPSTFAVTPEPANDKVMGMGMLADADGPIDERGNVLKVRRDSTIQKATTMPDNKPANEDLEARIASLETEAKRAEALEKELDGLKTRIAGLAGVEEPESETFDATAALKGVEGRIASAEKQLEELVIAGRQAAAENFAEKLFEEKEISVEAKAKWASMHLKDAETAESMADTLPARTLKPGQSRAAQSVPTLDTEEALAEYKASLAKLLREA